MDYSALELEGIEWGHFSGENKETFRTENGWDGISNSWKFQEDRNRPTCAYFQPQK